MLNPHDRRDLACLGLMVLVYGLALAPVLHAVVGHGGAREGGAHRHTHAHEAGGETHSHGPGRGASAHGLEHEAPSERAHPLAARHDEEGGEAPARERAGKGHRPHAPEQGASGDGHGPDGHQHLTGSVEHLHAMAAAWAVVKLPPVRAVSWLTEVPRGPSRAPGSAPRRTAMPQGP